MQKFLIWGIFITSILWVFIHQFLLLIPATDEWQYNLGMLFQAIALSYIAAFIFHLVHNVYPLVRFKNKMERVINQELSELWEVCNSFSYQMRFHSKVDVYISKPVNLKVVVPEQIKNLPVIPGTIKNNDQETTGTSYPIPADPNEKPIQLNLETFDLWSDTIKYVIQQTDKTLNLLLSLKEFVNVETLIKISLMQKALYNFQHIANMYEEAGRNERFDNLFLQKEMIKFYEALEDLKTYYKKHSEYIDNQNKINK
ncbi:hypothetical protein CN947_13455 [Bacillus cereus]|nr:hypothetical protein CN947_13455 [Bacillus cereus]